MGPHLIAALPEGATAICSEQPVAVRVSGFGGDSAAGRFVDVSALLSDQFVSSISFRKIRGADTLELWSGDVVQVRGESLVMEGSKINSTLNTSKRSGAGFKKALSGNGIDEFILRVRGEPVGLPLHTRSEFEIESARDWGYGTGYVLCKNQGDTSKVVLKKFGHHANIDRVTFQAATLGRDGQPFEGGL